MTDLEFLEEMFDNFCINNDVEFDLKIIVLKKIQKRIQKELTLIQ